MILPAILPEMRSTILLSLGTGWGAVLGAEYLGAQSGLGYIIVYAQQFAYLDRMFLVALLFILYTSISYWAVGRLTARMLAWAPPSQRAEGDRHARFTAGPSRHGLAAALRERRNHRRCG